MSEWLIAAFRAEQLQADHPGWRVCPVRRRDGAGVEAIRDEGGVCSLTGSVSEIEITADKTIPDHEPVVRLPARVAPFLMEVCDGDGAAGVRPVARG